MSETAAYAGEPSSVLQGKDANDYLERMGLRPVEVHAALKAGDVASEQYASLCPGHRSGTESLDSHGPHNARAAA